MALELRTVRGKKVVWDITRGGALRMATDDDLHSIPEKPADPENEAIPQPGVVEPILQTIPTIPPQPTVNSLTEKFVQSGVKNASPSSTDTKPNTNP